MNGSSAEIGGDVMPAGETAEYLNLTTHIDKTFPEGRVVACPCAVSLALQNLCYH
jgi:hypothetical protein